MDDTQGHLSGQRQRVRPADQQVPRVQAQVYRGALEHAPYGIGAFDQGADVRVQAHGHPGGASQRAHRPQVGQKGGPPCGVQLEGLVVTFLPAHRRHHHYVGPRAHHPVHGALGLGQGVDGRVVQDQGHEAAHGAQPVGGQQRGTFGRALGQEPVGTELGRHHPDLSHLGQHSFPGKLVTPPGDLTDPPGNRGGSNARSSHSRTSSTVTGRRSLRDSSHASAT